MDIIKKQTKVETGEVRNNSEDIEKTNQTTPRPNQSDFNPTKLQLDRGDSAKKYNKHKLEKCKHVEQNLKYAKNNKQRKRNDDSVIKRIDIEERRKIRAKYTFRPHNVTKIQNDNMEVVKNENRTQNIDEIDYDKALQTAKRQSSKSSSSELSTPKIDSGTISESTKKVKFMETKKLDAARKPIIKTVTCTNDEVRVYKAVTFVNVDKKESTPLQVKIPNVETKTLIPSRLERPPRLEERALKIASLVPEKPIMNRKKNMKRYIRNSSPDVSVITDSSPSTEVAKWVPYSIDAHTKPYYEAWVNTTLAAVSKVSKDDRLFLENNVIELDTADGEIRIRSESPELTYLQLADERYTGRIKINHSKR